MTDGPGKIPLDGRRVTLDATHNLQAWMSNMNCAEAKLRLAVHTVGDRESDVRAFLLNLARVISRPNGSDGSNGMPRRLKRNFPTPVRPQATSRSIEIEKTNRLKATASGKVSAGNGCRQVAGDSRTDTASIPATPDATSPCPAPATTPPTKPPPP